MDRAPLHQMLASSTMGIAGRIPKSVVLAALLGSTGLYLLSAVFVATSATTLSYAPVNSASGAPSPEPSPLKVQAPLRTLWFGHSLMQYRAAPDEAVPAIDIPKTVDAIHEVARKEGRSQRPPGITVSYYDGPHDLEHWLRAGQAVEKIRSTESPLDFVIGVGFMHLTPQKGGSLKFRSRTLSPPNLVDNLKGGLKDAINVLSFGKSDAREVERLTRSKYEFIKAVRDLNTNTTWLNYVAPVMSDRTENQASVDARFACIVEVAQKAGARAANVPVGRAFRNAEQKAERQGLTLQLQRADRLHYKCNKFLCN